LVKLKLTEKSKQKKEVKFNVCNKEGKFSEFTGYVSHEFKTFHGDDRVIAAEVKGDNNVGAYYIGFALLEHGLHDKKKQENFFKKCKSITFYSPTTERYQQASAELEKAQKEFPASCLQK
jgi:hypothetical protein